MKCSLWTAALAVLTASAASAQPNAAQPLLRPARDVDVTYQLAAPGKPLEQRLRWLASQQRLRIDPPSPGMHVMIDYAAKRMSVVRDAQRSVLDMAAPEGVSGIAQSGRYTRRGRDMVAGLACTEWDVVGSSGQNVQICVTDDGVLLRVRLAGETRVSAVSVKYAPQDPTVFTVPSDYRHQTPGAGR